MVMEVPGRHGGDAGGKGKQSEIGGFYFFPPGHPDYVPLPPGEAALIAGRQVRTVCVAEPYAAMSIVCMYVYIYIYNIFGSLRVFTHDAAQDVHPQERLAPHWSHVVFQSPSGAEIRAQVGARVPEQAAAPVRLIVCKLLHGDPRPHVRS
jgi:hypothetical protein